MKKLLPILLILIGVGAGGAGGFVLRPEPEPPTEEEIAAAAETQDVEVDPASLNYVKLNNQFVVPVVEDDKVSALVVLSISLETANDQKELIYAREPKIRDEFLRVLFDHAYSGGFRGAFTASPKLDHLSEQLLVVARKISDELVTDVLITDIIRQDN